MSLRGLIPAGIVACAALLLLLLQHAWGDRDRARRAQTVAEGRTIIAEGAGRLSAASAQTVEAAQTRELRTTLQAREAADEISHVKGAASTVAADVVADWGMAIDRLREPTAADSPHAGDSGS